mmetsp:Transcript_2073/g.4280  ORF Transcript_2073/g.4280 Transcript_2073/m.4280 type:complete len:241 (+) Transcript_2073:6-728(+)
MENTMGALTGKTIIVTGASRGLGKEFCKQLASNGNRVIAACRTPENVKDLDTIAELTALDVSIVDSEEDPKSISNWAKTIAGMCDHVDVVINNAGIYGKRASFEEMDAETMMEVYRINTVGPFMVSQHLFKHNLLGGTKPSIIANVTSKVGSVDDNGSGGSYAYRASKSALNNVNKSMSIDLAEDNITSTLLHPGWVRTDMTSNYGLIDVDESVRGMINVLETKDLQGTWHAFDGKVIPW